VLFQSFLFFRTGFCSISGTAGFSLQELFLAGGFCLSFLSPDSFSFVPRKFTDVNFVDYLKGFNQCFLFFLLRWFSRLFFVQVFRELMPAAAAVFFRSSQFDKVIIISSSGSSRSFLPMSSSVMTLFSGSLLTQCNLF
jgi:hypothetical protein